MEGAHYQPGQELPGTVYRVVRHLATGGMGSVYDVEDVTVGKRYVLKTLHPNLVARDDLARRMKEEARTLARLQHPNIVDVVTAGVTNEARPMPFYVMERLIGQNLRVVIEKKGSLDLSHAYQIAIDVLDALEHAHENSVIHRDVKPENIFLHRNANGTTTTKLLDFGIMRLLDGKMSQTHGRFIGTLRYASPEQILVGVLGPSTDLYSLGVVLFEMIAGRGPFDDVGDAFAVGEAHAKRPAPLVSSFVRVPPEVDRLVASALAKTPEERPRDAFTFASELRRLRREEENVPRSATAVNVLSQVPMTRHGAFDPFTGTEPSPQPRPHSLAGQSSAQSPMASTMMGMTPPSVIGATLVSDASHAPPADPAIAMAATLAQAEAGAAGIDRNAVTRASAGLGHTQRLAQNGTVLDDAPQPGDDVVRALGEHAPLVVPPTGDELVFPRPLAPSLAPGGTGPLSGEASTRPPERSGVILLVAASAAAVLLVGGALVAVTKPWTRLGALDAQPSASVTLGGGASAPVARSTAPAGSAGGSPSAAIATAGATATVAATAAASATATAVTVPVTIPKPAVAEPVPHATPGKKPRLAVPTPAATPLVTPGAPAPPRTQPRGAPKPEDVGFE